MDQRRAIVDIGSNTVRLVIYGGPREAPVMLANVKAMSRLGRSLDSKGILAKPAVTSALAALKRFVVRLGKEDVGEVVTVATAAVRDASNGERFLDKVRALGLDPRLLSGEEEARASAFGVIAAFPEPRGTVADLGGGSLELARVARGEVGAAISLPFGTLRLPTLRGDGPDKFARRLDKALGKAGWQVQPGEALYLVGGSHRALGFYALLRKSSKARDPHGLELTAEEATKACRAVLRGKLPAEVPGMPAARRASLPDAAALLAALVLRLQPGRVVFSTWGLREGLLLGKV